jgi:hypothetical protein
MSGRTAEANLGTRRGGVRALDDEKASGRLWGLDGDWTGLDWTMVCGAAGLAAASMLRCRNLEAKLGVGGEGIIDRRTEPGDAGVDGQPRAGALLLGWVGRWIAAGFC